MKRKLLFAAMTLIAGAWSLSASAQTWDGTTAGKVYLKNVASGKYWGAGNSWGTQASLVEHPEYVTLVPKGDGTFNLESQVSNGGTNYYFNGDFMDNGSPVALTFTSTGDGFTIANGTNYYGYDGSTTVLGKNLDATSSNALWQVFTEDDMLNNMKNATSDNPVDATFLILDPNFGRNNRNQGEWTMVASNQNLSGGNNVNNCAESYHSTFTLSQTVTVPNGYYKLTAQGFYRQDGSDNTNLPYFYINDEKATFPLKTGDEGNMSGASASFSNGSYIIDPIEVTVTTKSITVGAKLETNTALWCIWDNFVLTYMGPLDLSSYDTALAEAIATAEAITDPMNAEVASNLATAISTYKGKTYDNEDDYSAAISAVNTAITNANTSVANYAEILALLNAASSLDEAGQASYVADETIVAIQAAYDDRSIVSLSDDQKTAAGTALRTAAKAQTTEGADMTLAIVNPTIEGITGWTVSRPLGGNGPLLNGTAMEYWAGNASDRSNASFDYYQTITGLPNGTYTVSAEMYNSLNGEGGDYTVFSPTSGVYGTSNDTQSALVDVDGTTLTRYKTPEITVLNGTLRIGVKNVTTPMAARWFVADNFQLTYVGPIADLTPYVDAYKAALAAAKATAGTTERIAPSVLSALNSTITTYNEGQVDETSQSALKAATAALVAANEKGQTSIASYAVIAAGFVPDDQLDGWVCENTNTFHINTWSTEGGPNLNGDTRDSYDGTNMVTPFIENWVGKGSYLGAGKVYYRLEGLEPGEVYYAQAHVRSYNEANADAPNGPDFFINDNTTKLSEEGTTFTYNGMSGIYATLKGLATVGADGTLTLGVDIAADRNYNWVAFKSVKIQALEDADVIISEEDTSVPVIGVPKSVTLTRTLTGGQWNGFSVPFGFEVAGSDLDGAKVKRFSSVDDNKITLEDASVIEPGVPYLVRPDVDIVNPTFEGVEVSNPAEVKEGTGDYTFQAHLYNTPLDIDGSVAYVSTTDNSIKKLTSGSIKGLRAIFNIPTGAEAKALVVDFGEGTTGILNVDSEGNVYEGNVYNIAGQRVNMTQKGLYIVNGKKVLIK